MVVIPLCRRLCRESENFELSSTTESSELQSLLKFLSFTAVNAFLSSEKLHGSKLLLRNFFLL